MTFIMGYMFKAHPQQQADQALRKKHIHPSWFVNIIVATVTQLAFCLQAAPSQRTFTMHHQQQAGQEHADKRISGNLLVRIDVAVAT